MVGVVAALSISLGWSLFAVRMGSRLGLVDTPGSDALKVHSRPIPLLGGVGVFLGIHTGMAIEGAFDPALFVATGIVLSLGLVDDKIGLAPKLRLGIEIVAAMVLAGFVESGLQTIPGFVFATLFVVVAINAVNLLDGLDGLVGSITVVSGIAIAVAGSAGIGITALGFVLAAAATGFLILNWNPARIFLGDNGAYTVGMVLAYAIITSSGDGIITMLLVAVGVMGVFFIDLVTTILRRRFRGHPLFSGDRSHIYDQLRDRGWSVRTVAIAAAGAQALLGVVYISLATSDVPSVVTVAAIIVGGILVMATLWQLRFIRPRPS